MSVHLNTLYIMNQDAYIRRDHRTLVVEVDGETQLRVPQQHVSSVVLFGNIMITPAVLRWCNEAGVSLTYLTRGGRFICRMIGPTSGNVLLRMQQFEALNDDRRVAALARCFVAGKLYNMHSNVLRSGRDTEDASEKQALQSTATKISSALDRLERCDDTEQIRGIEGEATRNYFNSLNTMLKSDDDVFEYSGRNRRPPRDAVNALLSFLYALITQDCAAAVEAAGLDPQVGYLHTIRPGRPSLGLDLVEEFRPIFGDRLALTLINRRQLQGDDFSNRPGGAVEMKDEGLRTVLEAYQKLKNREITHPFVEQKMAWAKVIHVQARLLARTIRGELDEYPPFLYR